jgi:hypothetical protein
LSDKDEDTDDEEITKKAPKKRLQKGRKMADADADEDVGGGEAEKNLKAMMDDDGAFPDLSTFFDIFDSINTNISYHYRSSNSRHPRPTVHHPPNRLLNRLRWGEELQGCLMDSSLRLVTCSSVLPTALF